MFTIFSFNALIVLVITYIITIKLSDRLGYNNIIAKTIIFSLIYFVFTLYRINIEDYYEAGNLIGVNSPLKFDWFGYIFLSITKLIFTTITGFASAFIVIYTYGNTQKGWIENAIYSFLLFLLSILGAYDLATFSDLFMMCTNQMPSSFLSICWSLIIALILTPLVYFLTKKLIKKIQKSTKYSEVLELVEDFTLFSEIPDKNIDSEDLRRPN